MTDHEPDTIVTGDAFDVLPKLPDESVHACVSDPPYGLAFMGRDWDDFEPKEYQEWCEQWAREVKRVLKPGGHLLAFSGNRTHHRLFTGVEDAGFEVRDTLTWHYGSGFPKASDVSKTIDKRADADREVVAEREAHDMTGGNYGSEESHGKTQTIQYTEPATEPAEEWDGWKTGLKPATEFVVMARKPFDGATVDCVLEHGTGALNIGECRVDTREESQDRGAKTKVNTYQEIDVDAKEDAYPEDLGRYPANAVFGQQAAEALDDEEGDREGGQGIGGESVDGRNALADSIPNGTACYDDNGGPSRYFYTSKASKSERTLDGWIENAHPTVKPQDLMEWLIKLVTREEQVVLDPFTGSGTTCRAAKELNRQFIGIERQSKWADVARVRCNLTPEDPTVVRENENQTGWEAW